MARNTSQSPRLNNGRVDSIISLSMPAAGRVALDLLAGYHGVTRSELVRFLVIKSLKETAPQLLEELVTETLALKRGRREDSANYATSRFSQDQHPLRKELLGLLDTVDAEADELLAKEHEE